MKVTLKSLLAMAAVTSLVATADFKSYKESTEGRLKDWDSRIELLKKEADNSPKPGEERLRTTVRDLESHRDRIKDELGRLSEKDPEGKNVTAESNIGRHFQQMQDIYMASRNETATKPSVTQ